MEYVEVAKKFNLLLLNKQYSLITQGDYYVTSKDYEYRNVKYRYSLFYKFEIENGNPFVTIETFKVEIADLDFEWFCNYHDIVFEYLIIEEDDLDNFTHGEIIEMYKVLHANIHETIDQILTCLNDYILTGLDDKRRENHIRRANKHNPMFSKFYQLYLKIYGEKVKP